MKIKNKTLEQLAHQNYPFAYALLPDELMATQLLIDSITKMAVIWRDLKEELPPMEVIELNLLKNAFELSLVRSEHFKDSRQLDSFNHTQENSAFYILGIRERAAIFLRDHLKVNFRNIAYILDINYEEALALCQRARAEFIDLIEHSDAQASMGGASAH